METITINQLFQACKEEIAKGNGDKYILISSDDEGNCFHELFYLFSHLKGEDIKYGLPYGVSEEDVNSKYIILG